MAQVDHRAPDRDLTPSERTDPPDTVSVADLLAEPLLRNTLVAGRAGTWRTARWCVPLSELGQSRADDAPDDGPDEGLVVHASAEHLRGDEGARTVRRVAGAGAVALLVRVEPSDVAPPAELRRQLPEARSAADAVSLPLALLPPTAGFRAVSQLVATKVLAQTTHVLQYSDRVHRSLGEILARGAGIPSLAGSMARMVGTPVMVVDLDGNVLAYESSGGTRKPSADPVVTGLRGFLEDLTTSPLPAGATALAATGQGPDLVVPLVAPVAIGREPSGLVAVLEPADADPHDRAQRRIVVQEGAVLIGSEMLRIRSMTEAEERTRGDFVVDLVHGRFADGPQLIARARHHGYLPDGRYAVLVAEPDPPVSDDARAVRRFQAAARAVERLDRDSPAPTLATQLGGNLVVVAPATDRTGSDDIRDVAGAIGRVLRDRLGAGARVAFGRTGVGASGTATSYREARTALSLSRRVDVPPVVGYEDLRIFVALRDLADSDNGRRFAADILAPLRRADGHNRSLENVVLAYIAESGNLNAAARRLGLHRNTTLYKLERISRVMGMDIRSADTQFMVWLAHHVDTLTRVNDDLDAELAPPP